MKSTPFSKNLILLLKENEFEVKSDDPFLTFNKLSWSKAILLIPVFFITLIAVAHIQQHPLKTLAAILSIALITKMIWIHLTKHLHFQIDFSDNTFKFFDQEGKLHWAFLNEIEEIYWVSRFEGEAHEVSIHLRMNNNSSFKIFQFQCEYPEATIEIIELYSFLEKSINKIRVI